MLDVSFEHEIKKAEKSTKSFARQNKVMGK